MDVIRTVIKCLGLFCLIGFLSITHACAADLTENYLKSKPGGNTLDKKQWERLKNDYRYKSLKIDTTQKKQSSTKTVSIYGGAGWFKLLAWAAVFLLIAGLIYLLARFGRLGEKDIQKKIVFDVNKEPQDINDIEIDPLLAEALKNKDYKLAVRLRFLMLLQMLNTRKLIQWKRDKTNRDYILQLKEHSFQLLFRQLCLIYESVWYGNYPVDETGYKAADDKFKHISSEITGKIYV